MTVLQGSPSTAVQWGAWAAVGMAAADGALVQRLVRQGYGALSPQQGLAVLAHAVSSRAQLPVLAASPFDFATFLAGEHHMAGRMCKRCRRFELLPELLADVRAAQHLMAQALSSASLHICKSLSANAHTESATCCAGHRGKMPFFSELLGSSPAAPVQAQPAAEPSVFQTKALVSISTISNTILGLPTPLACCSCMTDTWHNAPQLLAWPKPEQHWDIALPRAEIARDMQAWPKQSQGSHWRTPTSSWTAGWTLWRLWSCAMP